MIEQHSAFRDVMVACRPQRVAISFDASEDWQTRAAVALAAMGKAWGGRGFILVPHNAGNIHPALMHIARLYDPDYVNEFNYTDEDVQAEGTEDAVMSDGDGVEGNAFVVPSHVPRIVARPPDALLDATSIYRTEILEDRCPHGLGWMRSEDLNNMTPIAKLRGLSSGNGVYLAVPSQAGGTIGLAMAMRCGFITPPRWPFEADPTFVLSEDDVGYALGIRTASATMLQTTGSVAIGSRIPIDTPTAWSMTEAGLTTISFNHPILRPSIVVVGSAAEDFALALALMQMSRNVLWLPVDVVETHPDKVNYAIFNFFDETERRHGKLKVTSISLDEQAIEDLLGDRFRDATVDAFTPVVIPYVLPEDVAVPYPTDMLGCTPEFDDQLTLPTLEDNTGGIDLAQGVPYKIPECAKYAVANRPFWEVDVTIKGATTPLGRNSSHLTSADDPSNRGYAIIRSSQAGLSFNALSDGWTDASQPIRQSIARPKLRSPGMLEWVHAHCQPRAAYSASVPSDAGRRAMIATDLFGGRRELAAALKEHGRFFREFLPQSDKKEARFSDDDGFFIKDLEGGVVSFRGALRVLSRPETEVRDLLDTFLTQSILRRGLVLECNACRRLSFFAIDAVGQSNRCPRCNSSTPLTSNAWIGLGKEPEWFYDLHSAVSGLIQCNADVPLMTGAYLQSLSRSPAADIPELDFITENRPRPDEIDIVSHTDNQILVGEAKCIDHIGASSQKRKDAANKLVRVAQFLHADQIVLASSAEGPWRQASVDTLANIVNHADWSYGPRPRIRLITEIGTESVKDVDVMGRAWKDPHR